MNVHREDTLALATWHVCRNAKLRQARSSLAIVRVSRGGSGAALVDQKKSHEMV
jgi:hypothetical protein